jgi:hypothetical protein
MKMLKLCQKQEALWGAQWLFIFFLQFCDVVEVVANHTLNKLPKTGLQTKS